MDTLTAISRLVVFIDTSLKFVIGLCIVLLFTIVPVCFYRQKVSKKTDKIIHLLLNIFVPTAVAWEHDYSKLFRFSKGERRTAIWLSLSSLLQNLSNGSLELRDPNDLAPLLSSRLHVSGRTLALKIELTWRLRTFYRLALDKSFPGMVRSDCHGLCSLLNHLDASTVRLCQVLTRNRKYIVDLSFLTCLQGSCLSSPRNT